MTTKTELMAYLTLVSADARAITFFTRMSDTQVATFLTVRCGNTEAGVDQQLTRWQ